MTDFDFAGVLTRMVEIGASVLEDDRATGRVWMSDPDGNELTLVRRPPT